MCGAVRYVVDGALNGVVLCHCSDCLRWHGHVAAFTSAPRPAVRVVEERGLRWVECPGSDARARRAFCAECGSSLFWDAPDDDTISIAAGTVDPPTGLKVESQVYVAHASDYYKVDPDVPIND